MPDTSSERLHALDAVRGFALLLGIVYHATASFLPGPPGAVLWVAMDGQRSIVLAIVFHVLHAFRMSTFFFIAGFFAHMSFHKKGLDGFVRDRAKRIALPLVFGWPILFAASAAVSLWGALAMAHGQPLAPTHFLAIRLVHLWFLYVLLLLYGVTLILRGIVVRFDRDGRVRTKVDRGVRWLVENPLGLALLAAPTALTLALSRHWLAWFGISAPDTTLLPSAGTAVAFFTAFAFGWLVHRQLRLLEIWERRWGANLALSIVLSAAGFAIIGVAPVLHVAQRDWHTALYAAVFTLSIWTWTFGLIGVALRFLSGYSATRRYIADSSYWLYLVHVPLVIALQVAVSEWNLPWWVKFPLILAVAFPILLASYQLFVRYTFVGAILNGRRMRRPPRLPAQPVGVAS